jgi:hypothetical protein
MTNKLRKAQYQQINNIDSMLKEGLLTPLIRRILAYRLEKVLKVAYKDPHLRAAFDETLNAFNSAEDDLKVSNNIMKSYIETQGKKLTPDQKELQKLMKDLKVDE